MILYNQENIISYSWSGSLPMNGHTGSTQRSYSLSPPNTNRSAISRGLWVRGVGNKDKSGASKSPFFWRSSSESSGGSTKMVNIFYNIYDLNFYCNISVV